MGIFSSIFGGGTSKASRESQAAAQAENLARERFIREQSGQARQDVSGLFPQAQDVSRQGFQGALDLIGLGVPAQLGAFQQGNIGAQQAISSTLPQIQNAILGLPVDFGQFQPQQLNVDTSFLQGLQAPQIQQPQQTAPPQLSGLNPFTNRRNALPGFASPGFSGGPGRFFL